MERRPLDLVILFVGVCAVSTAALFIREADAPALVIAAYRLTLASLPLLGAAAVSGNLPSLGDRTALAVTCFAGVCLALHFAFWIASVQQTSVVTSVVLVTAQPLFVAAASGPLLGERPGIGAWFGILLAALGAAVMVADDLGAGAETLQGDLFALLGALFASAYFIAGRKLRLQGQGWLTYAAGSYSVSAATLMAMAVLAGEALSGYSTRSYIFMLLLAIVPQLIGHTALNRSLGYLPAVAVTIAVLGEPIGATLLAAAFLGERPTWLELAGAALVLAGVYAGLRGSLGRRGSKVTAAPPTRQPPH